MSFKEYVFLIFLILSLLPYVATGYYDWRYFTLFFLVISVFTIVKVREAKIISMKFVFVALMISCVLSLKWFAVVIYKVKSKQEFHKNQLILIETLRKEQLYDNKIYIFANPRLAARYGALTGGKAAMLPSNFDKLDDTVKKQYFSKMEPYRLILEVVK